MAAKTAQFVEIIRRIGIDTVLRSSFCAYSRLATQVGTTLRLRFVHKGVKP